MELPAELKQAVERELERVPLADLQRAADTLSRRYRAETRDGRLHLAEDMAVKAYLAARLPATFAALRASMEAVAEAMPDFRPHTILDVGAGPGSALWAAADCWDGLSAATLVEASDTVRGTGQRLAAGASLPVATWIAADVSRTLPALKPADLVTMAYVLDELAPAAIPPLIERLWALTIGTLLIVEPGTPAGWARILDVRRQLIAAGAHVAAPCPHEAPCPLAPPDWCHFSRRVARSRLHRLTKSADVPWEDEKFIYLAASRTQATARMSRVLAPPRSASGRIALKPCQPDGRAEGVLVTKRDGETFKQARRLDWGDSFDSEA